MFVYVCVCAQVKDFDHIARQVYVCEHVPGGCGERNVCKCMRVYACVCSCCVRVLVRVYVQADFFFAG